MKTAILVAAGLTLMSVSTAWSQAWSTAGDTEAARYFVKHNAQISMAEIEFGKMAAKKAQREDVRKFALEITDEQTKARPDLREMAMQKYIPWPNFLDSEHRALRDRLLRLTGDAFDQTYLQMFVDRHRTIVKAFRTESQSGKDPEVRAWAAKALPGIEERLKRAEAMSKAIGAPPVRQQAAR
jgi:putative membrane protein